MFKKIILCFLILSLIFSACVFAEDKTKDEIDKTNKIEELEEGTEDKVGETKTYTIDEIFNSKGLYQKPKITGTPDFLTNIPISTLRFCYPDAFFEENIKFLDKVIKEEFIQIYDEKEKDSRAFIQNAFYLLPLQLNAYSECFFNMGMPNYYNDIFFDLVRSEKNNYAIYDIYFMIINNKNHTKWLYNAGYLNNQETQAFMDLKHMYDVHPFILGE